MADVSWEIDDDVKRQVLGATDLVALVGGATQLKKAGRSWKGLCPFHGEKTPSFHVHPDRGFYYCFGCGAKGDAITFVRETERLEFPEAVAYLARLAGVTLRERKRGSRAERTKETRVPEALAAAARFFREHLSRHAAALALLEKRGLSAADGETHGIGAAPDAWDALKAALADSFPEETLLEAGLLQRHPETGRVYDRFRNRLTIEIRDARGEVLGFGARALGDDNPKYLNSPETPRFSKGKLLYGLDRAKAEIRRTDEVVLVEGYFDRIALERAGVANAVASMGTALTPAQADLLRRQAATVVVGYDGDAAGLAAARKAFPLLLERGAAVRHLRLPAGHDPDSYLEAEGPAALRDAVSGSAGVLDSLLRDVDAAGSSPEERSSAVREAKDVLGTASDPVLRFELLSRLARHVGTPLEILAPEISRLAAAGRRRLPAPGKPKEAVDPDGLPETEEAALSLLMNDWSTWAEVVSQIPAEIFSHPLAKEILAALQVISHQAATLDFSALETHLDGAAGRTAVRLMVGGPVQGDPDLRKRLLALKIRHLKERRATLLREAQIAQDRGETARAAAISPEIGRLSGEIRQMESSLKEERRRSGRALFGE